MRLSNVVGRDSPVEWYEAVAVVRELIARLEDSDPVRVPELHQVELLSIGTIELTGGESSADPVLGVNEILRVLLAGGNPPEGLAAMPEQPFPSIGALSEALAYFERPNRSVVLQQLHRRMIDSVPVPGADDLIASLRATATQTEDEQQASEERSRRRVYFASAAVAGLVIVAVGLGLWWRGGLAGTLISDLTGVSGNPGTTGDPVSSIGGEEEVPASGAPLEMFETASTTGAERTVPATRPAPAPRSGPRIVNPVVTDPWLAVLPRRPTLMLDSSVAVPRREVVERVIQASEPDVTIYSAASSEVDPPVGIRPYVPTELPPDFNPQDALKIEIVINTAGIVESAKLVGPSRVMYEAMFVSAAKAWQFHPAMRRGVPVRYRTTVLVPW